MRTWMFSLVVVVGAALAVPSVAAAQDDSARWTPKQFTQSELIDFGTFGQSPLELPWAITKVEEVTNAGRIDFKHLLEADVREVEKHFDERYESQQPAVKLKKGLVPKGKSRELNVLGKATQGDVRNFSLGNSDLRQNFIVRLKEENGRAALVYQNMNLTEIFGGNTPGLAPFKPVDADPIPVK